MYNFFGITAFNLVWMKLKGSGYQGLILLIDWNRQHAEYPSLVWDIVVLSIGFCFKILCHCHLWRHQTDPHLFYHQCHLSPHPQLQQITQIHYLPQVFFPPLPGKCRLQSLAILVQQKARKNRHRVRQQLWRSLSHR